RLERRAKLVAYRSEKVVLHSIGDAGFFFETAAFDHETRTPRELFGELQIVGRVVAAGFGEHERHGAKDPRATAQRNDHGRLEAELADDAKVLVVDRAGLEQLRRKAGIELRFAGAKNI